MFLLQSVVFPGAQSSYVVSEGMHIVSEVSFHTSREEI